MKNIGVIGGAGPLATADFFEKIIRNTNAKKDQDNIPVLIYNNPQIPDRTSAILDGTTSPVDEIVKTAILLQNMGADFLCLPCNTSFYYYDEIQSKLDIKLLNMIDITVTYIKQNNFENVCILGTRGTIEGKVYYKKLDEENINYINLDDNMVQMLSYVIYDVVKKNNFDTDITEFRDKLMDIKLSNNNTIFVLACTELPILFEKFDLYKDFDTIDPTILLAKKAIQLAL